jgi:hypothetical protein
MGLAYYAGAQWEAQRHFLYNDRPPNDYEAHIWYAMDYACSSSERNDVIFLGDSSCFAALRTRQFEQLTGKKAYNLGCPGVVGVDGFTLILQTYLQHHPKPRVVVFCVHPVGLTLPPEALGPKEVRERFFWCYGSQAKDEPHPLAKSTVQCIRRGARVLVGRATGGAERYADAVIPKRDGKTLNSLGKEVRDQRGFWEWQAMLPLSAQRQVSSSESFFVSDASRQQLAAIARLTHENGILLLIRLAPVLQGDASEDFVQLRSRLAELETAEPDVIVSRPEVVQFGPYSLAEMSHCNQLGATAFTKFVVGEVT